MRVIEHMMETTLNHTRVDRKHVFVYDMVEINGLHCRTWPHGSSTYLAMKPVTTPSTTSVADNGFWREAWNCVQYTCCTGHRVLLLLVR